MDRLENVQKMLAEKGLDALIIEDKVNLFYLSGIELSAGKLIITLKGGQLFVDGRYLEICQQKSPFPVQLLPKEGIGHILQDVKVGFLSESTSYKSFQNLQTSLKTCRLEPLEDELKKIRALKDPSESTLLKEAAHLGSQGYDFVLTLLKPGISELEVASELDIFWKRKGSQGVAFDSIIAFGENSSMPHYRAGSRKLQKVDSILIDIGVKLNHYHSDMTRVVFLGKPHPEMQKIYQIVRDAQQAALDLCKPNVSIGELDDAARNRIKQQGYGDKFVHSLGHGIGLEVHEYPLIRRHAQSENIQLEPGMAITIEPGIYLPGIGGVRIEDTVLITEKGYENLTQRATHLKNLAEEGS